MRSLFYVFLGLAPFTSLAFAEPNLASSSSLSSRRLIPRQDGPLEERKVSKRGGVISYDKNCGAAPPKGSNNYKVGRGGGAEFTTMEQILRQAVADAQTMALRASEVDRHHPS